MLLLLLACSPAPEDARLTALGFTSSGLALSDDRVEVGLDRWGRGSELSTAEVENPRWAPGSEVGLSRNAVVYNRGGVTEWWTPAGFGWEHGFTLAERPPGEGALRFEIAFDGLGTLEVDGQSATAELGGGRELHYTGLVAWDAERRPVAAHMEPTDGGVALVVDDAGATYPLVVDPVLSVASSLTLGGVGASSGGGDLNNDGYADIVAIDTTTGQINWWLGSASGIASTPSGAVSTVLPSTAVLDGIGDFNGDGYGDVVAGDSTFNSGRGAVYVFYGRAAGLRTSFGRRFQGLNTSVGLGAKVGGVGDTNGDGRADIGAWASEMTARVWQGQVIGSPVAAPIAVGTGYGESYYDSPAPGVITGLGDLNGDGYDEVGVSYSAASRGAGRVFWYYGSASGTLTAGAGEMMGTTLHAIEDWCAGTYSGSVGMGRDLAALGDLDLDGYDDFALSQNYESCVGYDYVGYGGSGGPATSLTAYGALYGAGYAGSLAGGDFDGDGYRDVAGGLYNVGVALGSATRFTGTAAYTVLSSTWTAYDLDTAGDVNGDGCDDLLVRAGSGISATLQVWEGCVDSEAPYEGPDDAVTY